MELSLPRDGESLDSIEVIYNNENSPAGCGFYLQRVTVPRELLGVRSASAFGIWKFCCPYYYFNISIHGQHCIRNSVEFKILFSDLLIRKSSILAFHSLQTIQLNFLSTLSFFFPLIS